MIKQANAQVNSTSVVIAGQPRTAVVTRRRTGNQQIAEQPCGGQAYPFLARMGRVWQDYAPADRHRFEPRRTPHPASGTRDKVVDVTVEWRHDDSLSQRA